MDFAGTALLTIQSLDEDDDAAKDFQKFFH